jgi:flagellar assembly protein FliH
MNNTSRVLHGDELNGISQVWWRDTGSQPEQQPHSAVPGGGSAKTKDTVEREAYQRGFAEGQATGKEQAAAELKPVVDRMAQTLAELTTVRSRLRREAEKDLLKLAIAIARRVLHRELATDPEAILGLVMAASQKLNARETRRLRVSPADAALLEQNRGRLEMPAGLEIVADVSLGAGSAIFETSRGELDASVDTQLSEIDRGFADVMRRRG